MTIAKVLSVSRQALYRTPRTPRTAEGKVVPVRLVAPALPEDWAETEL